MLSFIGTGSAFNAELGNNSAYVKKGDSLLLIDCGGMVFHELQTQNVLEGVDHAYVIITHMHPDHVGSLGDVILYSHYILNRKVTLIYPNKAHLESYLEAVGVTNEMYYLFSGLDKEISLEDENWGHFSIQFIRTSHVKTIEAYGCILELENKKLYYSGDANEINSELLERFKAGEINFIYQDTCGLDYQDNAHMSLCNLKKLIELPYRQSVYCMHLDQHITPEAILNEGFNVVAANNKVRGQLRLRPFKNEDMILFKEWLKKDYVAKWYKEFDEWVNEVEERFTEFDWVHHFITMIDDKPIGFCQFYEYEKGGEDWQGDTPFEGTYSLDYLIGEEAFLRKGLGRGTVKLLVDQIKAIQDAKRIIVQPEPGNKVSCNTLLSAGFSYDEKNKIYLMELER